LSSRKDIESFKPRGKIHLYPNRNTDSGVSTLTHKAGLRMLPEMLLDSASLVEFRCWPGVKVQRNTLASILWQPEDIVAQATADFH
jgi:hypothetical protein